MRETNSVAHIQACILGKGKCFAAQKELMDDVIRCLLARGTSISNKSIILQIMARLTGETDVHRQETLRVLLQLVMRYTPDDQASENGQPAAIQLSFFASNRIARSHAARIALSGLASFKRQRAAISS